MVRGPYNTKRRKRKKFITFILILFICVSVGYALLSNSLSMSGVFGVKKANFDVHFENAVSVNQVNFKHISGSSRIDILEKTTLKFNVNLDVPGDLQYFKADVVNGGTIDAMINSIKLEGLPDELKDLIEFSVKYSDDNELEKYQFLGAGNREEIYIRVRYKDEAKTLFDEQVKLTLSCTIEYVPATDQAIYKDTTLFGRIKGTSLGRLKTLLYYGGIFEFNEGNKPIYVAYNKKDGGNDVNNNIEFGGYCWRFFRTSADGSIKMIYSGVYDDEDGCGTISSIGKTAFNNSGYLSRVGYMYGEDVRTSNYYRSSDGYSDFSGGYIYGNDVKYENGKYKLVDTYKGVGDWNVDKAIVSDKYHYTCRSATEDECEKVLYIISTNSVTSFYTLSNGESLVDIVQKSNVNVNNSMVKDFIDDWYVANLKKYEKYISDVVYCNDRRIINLEKHKDSPINLRMSFYPSLNRSKIDEVNFSCDKNDSFTVSSEIGNGMLDNPIGLITNEEWVLSGRRLLNIRGWTMSPVSYDGSSYSDQFVYFFDGNDYTLSLNTTGGVSSGQNVFPVVALKNNVKYYQGDGSSDNPYRILTDVEDIDNNN